MKKFKTVQTSELKYEYMETTEQGKYLFVRGHLERLVKTIPYVNFFKMCFRNAISKAHFEKINIRDSFN